MCLFLRYAIHTKDQIENDFWFLPGAKAEVHNLLAFRLQLSDQLLLSMFCFVSCFQIKKYIFWNYYKKESKFILKLYPSWFCNKILQFNM